MIGTHPVLTRPGGGAAVIYARWLDDQRMLALGLSPEAKAHCVRWAQDLLGQTWSVTSRTAYTNDCVFSDSSTMPVSLDHAWWLAEEKNSLRDWDPEKRDALTPTDRNIALVLKEKDEALAIWRSLNERLQANPGLTEQAHADLVARFRVFGLYTKGFALLGQTAILARRLIEGEGTGLQETDTTRYGGMLQERLDALRRYGDELREFGHEQLAQDYAVGTLLNPERVRAFVEDVERRLPRLPGT